MTRTAHTYHPQMTPRNTARPYDPVTNPMYPPATYYTPYVPPKGREWERYLDEDERTLCADVPTQKFLILNHDNLPLSVYVKVRNTDTRRRKYGALHAFVRVNPNGSLHIYGEEYGNGYDGFDEAWMENRRLIRTIMPAIVMDYLSKNGKGLLD